MNKSENSNRNREVESSSLENLDILTINNLSKEEQEIYKIKAELINTKDFIDMRTLTKRDILVEELQLKGYPDKWIETIVKLLQWITEEKNILINKLIVENILLPKLDTTYIQFKSQSDDSEIQNILSECYDNAKNYIKNQFELGLFQDFNLRNQAKVARGETFVFITNEKKNKYMVLEIKKNSKDMKIDIVGDNNFFARIHFDDHIDITKMPDIINKWKKIFNTCLINKKIRYILVNSWLFDDEFNAFWMNERIKEWNTKVPNRIKIREELQKYWWKLPAEEPSPDDPIDENFIEWEENSMTRAVRKYLAEGRTIKEGWGFIDLHNLEKNSP